MADEFDNDDWLYGETNENIQQQPLPTTNNVSEQPPGTEETVCEENNQLPPPAPGPGEGLEPEQQPSAEEQQLQPPGAEDEQATLQPPPTENETSGQNVEEKEDGELKQNGEEEEDQTDDSDDDEFNVVIDEPNANATTSSNYTPLNIKRGGLLTSTAPIDKSKQMVQQQQAGKFQIEEFDQIGTINGVPAAEYNLDSLEDKPWRKPGADITDYFNYGFNEDTWRAYCERQKRMRMTESGVGLQVQMTSIARAGPPPGRRMTGPIDVIGGVGGLGGVNAAQRMAAAPMGGKPEPPKMNVIQVMTADRREYSRKPTGFPDMTVPPPVFVEEFQPEYGFNPEPEPFYGGYEPTQEAQWGAENEAPPPINWAPTDIKSLTPGPAPPVVVGPPGPPVPPIHMGPPPMTLPMPVPSPRPQSPPPKRSESKERERTRDREVSRARSERPKDRDREKSHRRERSRSKSRRHKSRSRSPSHRSHKKKKSRRHEESD